MGWLMIKAAALTKLSCLLADPTLSLPEIRSMMSKSIRGEITEQTLMSFSHPPRLQQLFQQQTLAPKQAALSALGYAIKKGNEAEVLEALKQAKAEGTGWLLNEFDYAGLTPMVSFCLLCHPVILSSLLNILCLEAYCSYLAFARHSP